MGYSFVKEFSNLPMNGRMISSKDLKMVLNLLGLYDVWKEQKIIPALTPSYVKNTEVFSKCKIKEYHADSVVVDKKNADKISNDNCFIVDSDKFVDEQYRKDILSKLPDNFGFVQLQNTEKALSWVLYDRNVYDIGLSSVREDFPKENDCSFFLYLKPNVFISKDSLLYPPVTGSKLLGSGSVFRFAYAQNILKKENMERYFKFMVNYLNQYNSMGQVSIFSHSIIPCSYSIKDMVECFGELFGENWSSEDTVFSFKGTIFLKDVIFGRKIAWEMGTGQFAGGCSPEDDVIVRQNLELGIYLNCWNVLYCFRDLMLSEEFSEDELSKLTDNDSDIEYIFNCVIGAEEDYLNELPSDFNSCVSVIEEENFYTKEDFRYRRLRDFVVPNDYFLESAYKNRSERENTPFKDCVLCSVDFNGLVCHPRTFNLAKLDKSFTIKGGLRLNDNWDYSKMFDLCDYSALTGRDYRSVLKIVQSQPVDSQNKQQDMGTQDILSELKGMIKNGYTLGEAKQSLTDKGVACGSVVSKLHDSLLNVCTKQIDVLLNPNRSGKSSSDYTVGSTQEVLVSKGYPRDVVNEAILSYIRENYLVN